MWLLIMFPRLAIREENHGLRLIDEFHYGRNIVDHVPSVPEDTTLDLHITAGFVRTGSDVPSLPVMSLKIKKNDWGWAKTGSEGRHHCRFVA